MPCISTATTTAVRANEELTGRVVYIRQQLKGIWYMSLSNETNRNAMQVV